LYIFYIEVSKLCLVWTYTFPEEFDEGKHSAIVMILLSMIMIYFRKKMYIERVLIIVVDLLCQFMTQGALWGRV